MRLRSKLLFAMKSLFAKRKLDEQLSEEIRAHVDMATEANVAAGMSPDEARYAALREFGNVAGVQERARDEHGWVWLEQVGQDLRYAIRGLAKTPGFTAIILVILGVGIGANTALFSTVNGLLLRSLPVKNPGELVLLGVRGEGDPTHAIPYPLYNKEGWNHAFPFSVYEHLREQNQSFAGLAAFCGWPAHRRLSEIGAGSGEPERIVTNEVSGNYFPVLAGGAAAGRLLDESDDRPGQARTALVLSHAFWQRRFASDLAIVGREVTLDGIRFTIVGVAARGFTGPMVGSPVDAWLPLQLSPQIDQNQPWAGAMLSKTRPWLFVFGRLKSGVTSHQAGEELNGHFHRKLEDLDLRRVGLAPEGESRGLRRVKLELLSAKAGFGALQRAYEKPLAVLMAMVGLLLLVACANVAGLLLARGAAREREFAMRSALGASRRRLAGQIMAESLLLAFVGGLAGVAVAWGGTHWLGRYIGAIDLGVDGRVVGFALGATLFTGIVFGLLPAWRLSRLDLMSACKWTSGTPRRLNRVLVVLQISLAFVLGIAALLLGRTFRALATSETGFVRERLLLAMLDVDRNTKPEQRLELNQRLLAELAALPAVQSATVYQGISLLGPYGVEHKFEVVGGIPPGENPVAASVVAAGPGFFKTMGIPLLRGADFIVEAPRRGVAPPIVISEWSARMLFGEDDPVGRRIKLGQEYEITGVAQDIKYGHLRDGPRFVFYVPLHTRLNTLQTTLAIRSHQEATVSLADLRAIMRRLDAMAVVPALTPVAESLANQTRQERMVAQLSAFFGGFVLVLAALGMFGLLSFGVTRRTRELGVRVALGAPAWELRLLVLREGLGLLLAGTLIGALMSAWAMRFATSLFYGVSPTEPLAYGAIFLLLLVTAGLAGWLPARRAAKVDPMIALRAE